ncbi:MAG: hypothetical protein AB8B59_03275 [Maribacter sp.]
MKTTLKFFTLVCMAMAISLTSCTKEGPQGPIGPSGAAGIDGEDGTNGTNGNDGINGTNGTNGTDGQDGNANVNSVKFDITAASGTSYQLTANPLTGSIVEEGVVLAYVRAGNSWYQVPNQRIFTNGFALIDIASEFVANGNSYFFVLRFLRDGSPLTIGAGDLDELRIVTIPSTSSSGKSANMSELDRLYDAGVDLSDYHQVIQYYGFQE